MINAKREFQKFLISSAVFLLVVFIILMIQNVIRYGVHYTYNPWKSVLYLSVSLVIFIGNITAVGTNCLAWHNQSACIKVHLSSLSPLWLRWEHFLILYCAESDAIKHFLLFFCSLFDVHNNIQQFLLMSPSLKKLFYI